MSTRVEYPNGGGSTNGSTGINSPLLGRGTPKSQRMRARVYECVEGEINTWVEYCILILIFANVMMFIIGTYPVPKEDVTTKEPCRLALDQDCEPLSTRYNSGFYGFEVVSSAIFSVEYLLRIWSCVEDSRYSNPVWGRIRYIFSFYAVCDLLSFMPTWIELLPGVHDIESTGGVRIFRLVRVFKADKYMEAFDLLVEVLRGAGSVIVVSLYYAILLMIVFSVLLFYTERSNPDPDTANYFKSIPDAMWITVIMLTGEFPVSAFTGWGKLVTGILAVFAVAIFAVPTGVIGSGFVEALKRREKKQGRGGENLDFLDG